VCARAREHTLAMVHLQIEAESNPRLLRESRNVDGWSLFEREKEKESPIISLLALSLTPSLPPSLWLARSLFLSGTKWRFSVV